MSHEENLLLYARRLFVLYDERGKWQATLVSAQKELTDKVAKLWAEGFVTGKNEAERAASLDAQTGDERTHVMIATVELTMKNAEVDSAMIMWRTYRALLLAQGGTNGAEDAG